MTRSFKELTNYFIELGAHQVGHSNKTYLAHAIGVHRDLQAWKCDEELCQAGLFHSIYGTEGFQGFTLPLTKRQELIDLVGARAERIAFWNCFMDRSTLDAQLSSQEGPYPIRNRVTGDVEDLSKDDYEDLLCVHLCDWLEQVERSGKWHYRRAAYRQMAERLGGVSLDAYNQVFEREPQINVAEQDFVLRNDQGGVATLTLNRPQKYNALSSDVLSALQAHLDDIAQDDSVRVVVLAAKGKAFCAGHDLKEMRSEPGIVAQQALFGQCSHMMMSLMRLPQPVIAKVQGLATAAGCQLVAACDLAVAADTAEFATSGIRVGLFCSTPAVALSRNLSRKKAMAMLLTGDFIDAQTALQEGLVNAVALGEELDETVQAYIDAICAKSAIAVKIGKEMFYQQLEMGVESAYAFASERMACNMMTQDAQEGIDAFLEKRQPVWQGR